MDEQSGESEEEEVTGEGIDEWEMEELYAPDNRDVLTSFVLYTPSDT